jgi:DnaJ-class molecular chaperone
VFDHDTHKLLKCMECHTQAPASQATSDVLIPGIQTCQKCHRSGANSAESRCFECHTYHDWTKEKEVKGTFELSRLGRGN